MSMSNENNSQILQLDVGSQAATITLPVGYFPHAFRIKSLKLLNQILAAASDTNNVTVALKNGSTVMAQVQNNVAGGAFAANTAIDMLAGGAPVSASNPVDVPAGATLTLAITVAGTGALTLAQISAEGFKK